jgi:vacuolar-type H+-ATPase subunit F/Vma7
MFGVDNFTYYSRRAVAEWKMAATSPTPVISLIHEQLAEHYEELIAEIQARPPLRLVSNIPQRSFQADAGHASSEEAGAQTG